MLVPDDNLDDVGDRNDQNRQQHFIVVINAIRLQHPSPTTPQNECKLEIELMPTFASDLNSIKNWFCHVRIFPSKSRVDKKGAHCTRKIVTKAAKPRTVKSAWTIKKRGVYNFLCLNPLFSFSISLFSLNLGPIFDERVL